MIPRPARVLGIDITAEPRAGLMVRVMHWPVPDGKAPDHLRPGLR
jgi:hypothetical protein